MKKLNILICVLLILFSITACGNSAEKSEDETTTTPTTVLTTVPTSTTRPESNLLIIENKAAETESSTVVTTSVTTTESTTAYITTNSTTARVTTTKPTTVKATTAKPATTKKQATTKATTKVTTTRPTTTKVVTTTKPTTTRPATTVPITTTKATTSAKKYCTVRIECSTIYDNIGKLKSGKQAFLPANGVILENVQVELNGGESAFDVIKKACGENVCTDNCKYCKASGVQIEYTYTPAFNNYYIEGIHQIYEKDCGTQSGWMYSVNGVFPDVGTSSYTVSPGDVIVFAYTCNMGEDIGNTY